MVPIFRPDARKPVPIEEVGIPTNIEGELSDFVIVSIPATESHASARLIRDQLATALHRKVMIVTHNMQFLVTRRLPAKDAACVVKKMEDILYGDFAKKETCIANNESEKRVGELAGVTGDGDRSGIGDNGNSDIAANAREQTEIGGVESSGHGEGEEEGTTKSTGGD